MSCFDERHYVILTEPEAWDLADELWSAAENACGEIHALGQQTDKVRLKLWADYLIAKFGERPKYIWPKFTIGDETADTCEEESATPQPSGACDHSPVYGAGSTKWTCAKCHYELKFEIA